MQLERGHSRGSAKQRAMRCKVSCVDGGYCPHVRRSEFARCALG